MASISTPTASARQELHLASKNQSRSHCSKSSRHRSWMTTDGVTTDVSSSMGSSLTTYRSSTSSETLLCLFAAKIALMLACGLRRPRLSHTMLGARRSIMLPVASSCSGQTGLGSSIQREISGTQAVMSSPKGRAFPHHSPEPCLPHRNNYRSRRGC
jgi:hypothetical protein